MNCNDSPPPKPGRDADIYEVCPVARAFETIGSKWRLTVLRCLHVWGEQRFSELQETSTADSATLSRVLSELEEKDLVHRRLEDRPIATYYRLSERGKALSDIFEEFEEWALEWTAVEVPEPRVPE
jgi:DNA-binding HxlR family transcriptional regulator